MPTDEVDQFVGEIRALPYSFIPMDWIPCEGQILPAGEFNALFSLIGNTFGGDGVDTFGIPDLRGRTTISQGQAQGMTFPWGDVGGAEKVLLNSNQLPSHAHALNPSMTTATLKASSAAANTKDPSGNSLSANQSGNTSVRFNTQAADTAMNANSISLSGNTETAGRADSHENMQPSLVIRYCIAIDGYYPVRP